MNKEIQLFGKGLAAKKKLEFYSNLSTLLSSGLDVQRSLTLIEQSQKKQVHQDLFLEIRQLIVEGKTFSQALLATEQFSDYEVFSLQIGEETGQLVKVLAELSTYFSKSIKYRQQLVGALAYPVFVISFAILVVFFMLKYLVPLFSDIYKRFDGRLPTITQYLIDLSNWIGAYGGYVFLVLLALVLALYWQRRQLWFRKWSAKLLLRLPFFGAIVKGIYLSRFCQSMYLLLNAKVPLLRTVELVKQMIAFYPIEVSLAQAEKDIFNGSLLHQSLQKSQLYPQKLIALTQVGEEASNLDEMFQKLADQFSEDVEQRTALLGSVLEPMLIIGLGLIIGVILVAMYMPLFQLSVGVGG